MAERELTLVSNSISFLCGPAIWDICNGETSSWMVSDDFRPHFQVEQLYFHSYFPLPYHLGFLGGSSYVSALLHPFKIVVGYNLKNMI